MMEFAQIQWPFVIGVICVFGSAVAVIIFGIVGRNRWKIVAEGTVKKVEVIEVPQELVQETGFVSPAFMLTAVYLTDGTRNEIPGHQVSRCKVGERILTRQNWLGDREVIQMTYNG